MGRTSIKCFILITLLSGAWGLCFPSCSNSSGLIEEGSRVPDPSTCDQFYVCSDADSDGNLDLSLEPLTCPAGQYFDRETLDCELIPNDGSVYCEACNPCEVKCTEPGGVLPDPYSCNAYYVCLQGGDDDYITAACGDGQNFDFAEGVCKPAEEARCFEACDQCQIYCVEEGKLPDPNDCHAYLYCEPGIGTTSFQCPADYYYNAAAEECEEESVPCQNACSDSGSSGSPPPSGSGEPTTTATSGAYVMFDLI